MARIKLSKGYRVTIPAKLAREADLKPGDILLIEAVGNSIHITTEPEVRAKDNSKSISKSSRFSSKEEVDRYRAEVWNGWDINGLKDALEQDDTLRSVYNATSFEEARSLDAIVERSGVRNALSKLARLDELNAVKQLTQSHEDSKPHYKRIT